MEGRGLEVEDFEKGLMEGSWECREQEKDRKSEGKWERNRSSGSTQVLDH